MQFFAEKRPLVLSYLSKKAHMNELDFCQNQQNLIFGSFFELFGPTDSSGLFFFSPKNRASSLFLLHDYIASYKKSEKN